MLSKDSAPSNKFRLGGFFLVFSTDSAPNSAAQVKSPSVCPEEDCRFTLKMLTYIILNKCQ